MPNIITHGLFAKAVLDEINHVTLKEIIQKHPREFIIGSNGPDFFFFYKFFQKKYAPIRHIGSLVHSHKIHDFYDLAFDLIHEEKDEILKEAMTSYLAGHLCHWALDSRAHPYINYKTGSYSGISESWHHRFESMMDAMLLKKLRNESIKTYKFYLLAKQSPLTLEVISKFYIPIVKVNYDFDLTQKQIKDALNDWYKIQTYLYDPTLMKTKILKLYEKKTNHEWLYSGNVVPVEIDPTYDVLNEKKKEWCYPTDPTKVSHESFMEIYMRAKKDICEILNAFENKDFVLSKINNASYDTGESCDKEMKVFDYIYGGHDENI